MNIISKIGIGTVQFGLDYGISNKVGKTRPDEAAAVLKYARDAGMRYIDTARAYGDSEIVLGANRVADYFKVVSKFMPSATDGSIEQQFEKSCQNLRTERLYAYLAHRPLALLENKDDWDAVQLLKVQNKIQKIGFSLGDPAELEELLVGNIFPDLIQVPYNYFDNRFELLMIELKGRGCEIHTRSAFLQGLFFTDINTLPNHFDEVKGPIRCLQQRYGTELYRILLEFPLMKPFIDIVIVGVENVKQLKQNISNISMLGELTNFSSHVSDMVLNPAKWPKRLI